MLESGDHSRDYEERNATVRNKTIGEIFQGKFMKF